MLTNPTSGEYILAALTHVLANQLAGGSPATEQKIQEAAQLIKSDCIRIMGFYGLGQKF